MAICDVCNQEMLTSNGCICNQLIIDSRRFRRITVHALRCSDCGAKYGFHHHFGCDQEICPKCGKQLILCDCRDIGIMISE